jgi:hypothetical protein
MQATRLRFADLQAEDPAHLPEGLVFASTDRPSAIDRQRIAHLSPVDRRIQ